METKLDYIARMCSRGLSYREAEEAFYKYWELMIVTAKRERKRSLFVFA